MLQEKQNFFGRKVLEKKHEKIKKRQEKKVKMKLTNKTHESKWRSWRGRSYDAMTKVQQVMSFISNLKVLEEVFSQKNFTKSFL